MTEVYRVGYLERLPLGTPYPGIVAHVARLLGRLPGAELVIDLTGVGRPVFDMFRFSGITHRRFDHVGHRRDRRRADSRDTEARSRLAAAGVVA